MWGHGPASADHGQASVQNQSRIPMARQHVYAHRPPARAPRKGSCKTARPGLRIFCFPTQRLLSTISMTMRNCLLQTVTAAAILVSPLKISAQGLSEAFRPTTWSSYIFVSSKMPASSLRQLAREASMSRSTLVLRGFDNDAKNLESSRQFIHEINSTCCKVAPAWLIHPKLYDTFKIKQTPTFVLTTTVDAPSPENFAAVAGDMSLANALKYIVQSSAHEETKNAAATLYKKTFSSP